MPPLDAVTWRVIVSHGLAALALAMPWPLLLVMVHDRSNDPWLLGLVGAARMIPYVALSWATARLADAMRRDLIVRSTLMLRAALMVFAAIMVVTDHVWPAVAACTLAVAVGTPAYPAQVAAMPGIAGAQRLRATDLLVTVEVAAFVVGTALGGLLLHPATRELLPWVPAVMTVLALLMVFPVSMPAPVRLSGTTRRPSSYAALRAAPEAMRSIAVMAAINLVIALVAVALLPLALDSWSSDGAGYGLATGVLGFAALGAPLLRQLGRSPQHSIRWSLVLLALGLVLVAPVASVGWSLPPLALAGAAAVSVEAGATAVLQEHIGDEVRATVLGINDTVIIAAALVGSLVAPVAVEVAGGGLLLSALALATLGAAWWARPTRQTPNITATRTPDQRRATVRAHESAAPRIAPAMDRVARRTAVRRQCLLAVEQRATPTVALPHQRAERPAAAAEVRRAR